MTAVAVSAYVVHPWACDQFGHLNVRHYAAAFDDAVFAFWAGIGQATTGRVAFPVTLEVKTTFHCEAHAGTVTRLAVVVTRVGTKSVALQIEMRDAMDQGLLASCAVVEVFMDPATRQSCAIPDAVRAALGQPGG